MGDSEFLSVSFQFEGTEQHSLIRKKRKADHNEYYITVMNGKLEKLLFGNHILKEINGVLQIDHIIPSDEQSKLKLAIANELKKYLASPDHNREFAGANH
jgi:hypothetical protein